LKIAPPSPAAPPPVNPKPEPPLPPRATPSLTVKYCNVNEAPGATVNSRMFGPVEDRAIVIPALPVKPWIVTVRLMMNPLKPALVSPAVDAAMV
jgi:hypothetical protein